ncbi:MAG: hypothetical protein ACREMY_22730, partial [bacterium]
HEEGKLGEAESAFRQALAATDVGVRRRAEEGLRATRARMKGLRWRLVDGFYPVRFLLQYWIHLALGIALLILVVGLYAAYQYHQRRLRIVPPQQLTDSAPTKLLHAELLAAIDRASQVLRREGQLGYSSPEGKFWSPSAVAQEIADSLPMVKGVDTAKLYRILLALTHYLGWRLEAEIASTEHAITVFVWLKWGWKTQAGWRVPAVDGPNLTLTAAARQIALKVLWEMG